MLQSNSFGKGSKDTDLETKSTDQIIAIKNNNIVHTKEEEMCKILIEKFQSVFL